MTTPVAERPQTGNEESKPLPEGASRPSLLARLQEFKPAYWLAVPLLAVAAYASVLRIGFLADDFVLINQAKFGHFGVRDLLPSETWFFYRPVGWVLTWVVGTRIWGPDPLPFHALGLALHAATALVLGLWLAVVSGRQWVGLLAGCLFAVFPLHTEAVGWLAAQWDVWAAMFGLLSLWLYSVWWRDATPRLYALSLLCYFLGIFSKESLLPWLPMLALSAWSLTPRFSAYATRRVLISLLPFAGVLAVNVAARLVTWGNLGGYPNAPNLAGAYYLNNLAAYAQILLSPLNPAVFGLAVEQISGLVVAALLFCGLVYYGNEVHRILIVAGAWVVFSLVVVLNLGPQITDFQGNRFAYLAAAGYVTILAVLLWRLIAHSGRARGPLILATGVLLALCVVACWVQLRPWHTATVQMSELENELVRLVPPQPNSRSWLWYVQDPPDTYKGAYLVRIVLGEMRRLAGADHPTVEQVPNASSVDVASGPDDAFALDFFYSQSAERYHVSYASGITRDITPPSGQQLAESPLVWDFGSCAADVLDKWQVLGGTAKCVKGKGLVFSQASKDVKLAGPPIALDPQEAGARFVRLRAAVSYPEGINPKTVSQWFWQAPGEDWTEEHSTSMHVKPNGRAHVYWTYLRTSDVQTAISRLRFDPSNTDIAPTINWLAVDLVK